MKLALSQIEDFCRRHRINHRFVGGVAYTGWLNSKTSWTIDKKSKTLRFKNSNNLDARRNDGTRRDIDLIILNPSQKINKLMAEFIRSHPEFPPVSIEPVILEDTPQSIFPQFVTAIKKINNDYYFSFDEILEKISLKSLEPWKLKIDDLEITVRHPYADYLAYHFRVPSGVKPKDRQKVDLLKKISLGLDTSEFRSWEVYVQKLSSKKLKKFMTGIYWNSIGNFLGNRGTAFANKFTGSSVHI